MIDTLKTYWSYLPANESLVHFGRRSVKTRAFGVWRRSRLRWTAPTPREQEARAGLVAGMTALRPSSAEDGASWVGFTATLRETGRTRDPRAFLTWPIVRSTMFAARDSPWVALRVAALQASPRWSTDWQAALVEDDAGSPEPYAGLPTSSGTLIQHAYHLEMFEQVTGQRLQDVATVVEFGGGYGSMCRLLHRVGFQGTYLIQDLPESNEIQRYFLAAAGITPKADVTFVSDPDEIDRLTKDPDRPAALIATWSLSEAPVSVRDRLLDAVADFDVFLLSYQLEFDGVDNVEYFNSIVERFPDHEWHDFKCEGLPVSRYLFGTRKP